LRSRFTFVFPANGTLGSVWGTDLYTVGSASHRLNGKCSQPNRV